MKYTLVKPDGSLDQSRNFDEAPPTISPNKGRWLPDNAPAIDSQYQLLSVVVPVPVVAAEIPYQVTERPLQDLINEKRQYLNAQRDAEEASGFDYLGKRFDSDATAIKRIGITVQAAQMAPAEFTIDWTTQDGSIITLTKEQVLMMPVIMATVANAIHIKARDLKAAANVAESWADLELIQW